MSDWYKDDTLSTCLHLHIIIETNGGMHFVAGEVVDTVQERIRCLDCLEILTEVHYQKLCAKRRNLRKSDKAVLI